MSYKIEKKKEFVFLHYITRMMTIAPISSLSFRQRFSGSNVLRAWINFRFKEVYITTVTIATTTVFVSVFSLSFVIVSLFILRRSGICFTANVCS